MTDTGSVSQLEMPGMPDAAYADVGPADVAPGQEVLYLGRVNGGPGPGAAEGGTAPRQPPQ